MDGEKRTTRAIAEELAAAYAGDVVTGVAPGLTLADLVEVALDEEREAADAAREQVARLEAQLGVMREVKYPWRWAKDSTYVIFGDVFHAMPRVPPDTARRRLRRRQMETLEEMVEQARRMGKAVR